MSTLPGTESGTTPVAFDKSGSWTRQSVIVVTLCFLFNMIDGMDVLVVSYIAPTLQREFHVTPGDFSIVFSAALLGMAIGGILIAPLADRVGRRPVLLAVLTLMTLAMMGSSTARSMTELVLFRITVGIGIGTVLACIAALASVSAPPGRRDFAVGILQGGYPLGATLAGFATAWFLPSLGWRNVLLATGVVGALCVPLAWFFLPNDPPAARRRQSAFVRDIMAGDRARSTLLLWGATICSYMALYFIMSWITKLAIEAGLPETNAIVASAVFNIGSFCGVAFMSVASSRFDIRSLSCTLLVGTAVMFLWFGGIRMPVTGVLVAAFLLGVCLQGGFNALYPIAARAYPESIRATGIGWAMGMGRVGAFSGPLIGGAALSLHLPLVAVFGLFCVPLLIAAFCAQSVRFDSEYA